MRLVKRTIRSCYWREIPGRHQLPPALARLIQSELGAEASHVVDLGLAEATDAEVWKYASQSDSILISKDEDFVNMYLQTPTTGLLWVRIGNCRRAFLLDVFRQVWPRVVERLRSNDQFVEIR